MKFTIFLILILLTSLASINGQPLPPIAQWTFNEGRGTSTLDITGNGNNGSLFNGVTWTQDQNSGYALHFDGIDDYVVIRKTNSVDLREKIKIEAWIKRDSLQPGINPAIVSKELPFWLGLWTDGTVRAGIYTNGQWMLINGSTRLEVGRWYRISMTYDGSELKVFLDYQLENSAIKTGSMAVDSNPIYIGSHKRVNEFFNGTIDNVRIFSEWSDEPRDINETPTSETVEIPKIPEMCWDDIDNDNDNLIDCDDINDCAGTCIKALQQEIGKIKEENKELEIRTSELEELVDRIVEKGKCILYGNCN